MNRLPALAFALLLVGCNGDDAPPPPPQSSSVWTVGPIINGVNYSPTVTWDGASFAFPTAAPGVHGLTRASAGDGRSQITLGFRIDGDANFVEVDAGGGAPGPGLIRLFLQRCGDDWGGGVKASYRFYSQPLALGIGESVLQVPLRPEVWTNVNGQSDPDGFANLLNELCVVGMGFGGMFAMHGVYATGSARFTLISYIVE